MDKLILKSKLNNKQQDILGNIFDCNLYNDWIYYDESEANEDIKSTVEARGRKYLNLNDIDNKGSASVFFTLTGSLSAIVEAF